MRGKKKIKIRWTCSDLTHHEHWWPWTAWLCGRYQKYQDVVWALFAVACAAGIFEIGFRIAEYSR